MTMQIDIKTPVLRRQKIRRALDVALVCWVVLVALMVSASLLFQMGAQQ